MIWSIYSDGNLYQQLIVCILHISALKRELWCSFPVTCVWVTCQVTTLEWFGELMQEYYDLK